MKKCGKNEEVIVEKSFEFAVLIVGLTREIRERKEYELASQLLRSGTSIGANISEAQYAPSKKDFISKMNIALKEANETKYWLRLLEASGIMPTKKYLSDIDEIINLLSSIIKTSKSQ